MDRLESMALLIEALEAGSFSAASRKLRVPLPTLSRKIAELERRLGARLLVRSTRKLSLTETGTRYVVACKRILDEVRDAEAVAGGEYRAPKGDLIMTAPIVFGRLHVLPIVCDFLAQFPEIRIGMVLSDRNANLTDDHIDVAVRIGELPDSSMVAARVGSVRRVVCASPRYLAAHGTPKTPDDLSEHACITFAGLVSGESWGFAAGGRRAKRSIEVPCRLNVNTAEAAIDAAIADVGLTQVLSYQVTRAVGRGALRVVLKDFETDPMPVSLVHASQGLLPLKMRSFRDFAVPRLRQSLTRAAKQ